jgi:hypothetical protein
MSKRIYFLGHGSLQEPRVNDPRLKTGEYPPARLLLPGGLDGPWRSDTVPPWRLSGPSIFTRIIADCTTMHDMHDICPQKEYHQTTPTLLGRPLLHVKFASVQIACLCPIKSVTRHDCLGRPATRFAPSSAQPRRRHSRACFYLLVGRSSLKKSPPPRGIMNEYTGQCSSMMASPRAGTTSFFFGLKLVLLWRADRMFK